jgi:hypothetical protein
MFIMLHTLNATQGLCTVPDALEGIISTKYTSACAHIAPASLLLLNFEQALSLKALLPLVDYDLS